MDEPVRTITDADADAIAERVASRLQPRVIEPDAVYSVGQAAKLVPLSAFTLRRYLRLGVLRGKGRPWRIRGSELLKLA